MKWLMMMLTLFFLYGFFSMDGKPAADKTAPEISIEKLVPLMTSEEFRKEFPNVLPKNDFYSGKGNEPYEYMIIFKGNWQYEFAENILVRAIYDWNDILDYSDLNEGKSSEATELFQFYFKGANELVETLIEKYGNPDTLSKVDPAKFIATYDTYDTELIQSYWSKNGVTVRFNFRFEGRERPNPMQNNINGMVHPHAFRISIEVTGKEDKPNLHFRIGETAQEMEKRNPAIFKNGTGLFGNFRTNGKIGKSEGDWEFCFKNGKMQLAEFNSHYFEDYEKKITEEEYEKLVVGYRSAKEDLVKKFGIPEKGGIDEIPDFKTLEKEKVSGKDVMDYKWKLNDRTISLSLSQHYGGKGNYHHSMFFYVRVMDKNGEHEMCY